MNPSQSTDRAGVEFIQYFLDQAAFVGRFCEIQISLPVFILEDGIIRLDELGQTYVVRLVIVL